MVQSNEWVTGLLGVCSVLFSLFCIVPVILVLIVSFTSEDSIIMNGYSFFPKHFTLYTYDLVFSGGSSVLRGYLISTIVTCAGTLLAVIITGMAAYTLSNKDVKFRNGLALFFFITMIFHTGIVPWYLMTIHLGLKNNILALIIPSLLFNPFNLFLVRNFMNGLPDALRESAKMDGANDLQIAFKIFFPLSVPVLATVCLFYGLAYWNDWWNAIMLVDNEKLFPLQYQLFLLMSDVQMVRDLQSIAGGSAVVTPPTESLKMTTAIVTIGPIVLLYPFLQRYFVKGLIIGSVKG